MTEEEISEILAQMEKDTTYNTMPVYSSNLNLYPDNVMSFREKHMAYIKAHKVTNPSQYISNLKLMTKIG